MAGNLFAAGEPPTVAYTMGIVPSQKDVEYESPKAAEFPKCKVDVERKGKLNGWVVMGPAGQVLRKFLDTDGDGNLDQYRFYNHGIEVYRDIDSNHNKKIDQCRWLNLGGSRWGVDQNEDGHIDHWKVLSAAEASKEAIRAMLTGDDVALQSVMISADDLKYLGVQQQLTTKLLESAADPGKKAKTVMSKTKVVTPQSKWTRFDAQLPSTIPQDEDKASADLQVYESAMAIVETQNKFHAVQLGEMIRVGEVWKLTQVPVPIEGEVVTTNGGILMEPLIVGTSIASNSTNAPKVEKILNELQEIEQRVMKVSATPAEVKTLMKKRSSLLKEAIELAETDDEKIILMKQTIDGFAYASQSGKYPDGVQELRGITTELSKNPKSPLVPYASYRLMQAEYYADLQEAGDDKEKQADIQKAWLQKLEDFVQKFPTSEDADDAMIMLGTHEELQGHSKEAIAWYQKLVTEKPNSQSLARAQGALHRLNLNGQMLNLSGPGLTGGTVDVKNFRGQQVVLVVFWASEYKVCEEDVPQLRALYQDNQGKGFEIVGVALDMDKETALPFVKKNKMTWPQIYQTSGPNQIGGLESPLATKFGIISLPTMFLVNKEGKVVSRNASITEIKAELPELLKGASNVATKPKK
jgi:peroxiredoxin/TolA-binding protein